MECQIFIHMFGYQTDIWTVCGKADDRRETESQK
jgi:hypothetical protein